MIDLELECVGTVGNWRLGFRRGSDWGMLVDDFWYYLADDAGCVEGVGDVADSVVVVAEY